MKSVVDAKAFSEALDRIGKVLGRAAIPILEEISVRFEDGRCILMATDLDTWLTTELPAQGDNFSFVFSRTKDVVKACRHFDGELTVELIETGEGKHRRLRLYLHSGNRSGEFYAHPPEDYPERWAPEESVPFEVNAADLLERVERVSYAAMKPNLSSARANLSGIQFSENQIYAIDGYRAACDTDESLNISKPFLAFEKPLAHLKMFGDNTVTMYVGKRYIQITDGISELHFRLIDALPFVLRHAIPMRFEEEFYVSPAEFLRELTYLKEAAPNEQKPYVRFSAGELCMSALSGKYATSIKLDGGSSIVFGFDLRYMMDAMRQFKKEAQVKMKISGAYSPVVIEAEDRGDFALVLPVRLNAELAA